MDNHLNTKEPDPSSNANTLREMMFSRLVTYIFLERFAQLNPDLANTSFYQKTHKDICDRNAAFRVVQMVHHGDFESAYALLVEAFPDLMKQYEQQLTYTSVFLTTVWQCVKTDNPDIPDIEYPELAPNND